MKYLLTLLALVGSAAATDYCSISTCGSASHTMCLYDDASSFGPACSGKNPRNTGLSAAQQTQILAAHNQIRQDVANGNYANSSLPAATGTIPDLTWDDELATVAQRWVNQCVYSHDECRNVPRFQVGQNIYTASTYSTDPNYSGAATDWKEPTTKWFNGELAAFHATYENKGDLKYTKSTDGSVYGHLTQVIWADTTKLGCGFVEFDATTVHQGTTFYGSTKRYYCNYGKSGNFIDQTIYE